MKTSLRIGVAFAVLGAALASMSAQTQSTTVQVSKLVGTKVKSSQGDEIGVVKDVVIDRNSGCMAYTVLSTAEGGSTRAGSGGKLVAVPWAVYSPSSDVTVLTTTVDRQRIYNAPVFDYARIEEYSRPDYITNVYGYYGVTQGAGVGVSGTSTTTGVSGTSTTTGTSSTATTGRTAAGSPPPAGGTSPVATAPPGATRSPVERESPAGQRSPRARATTSPHERGEANATPSSRRERREGPGETESPSSRTKEERGAKAGPEETERPGGGAELQREPSEKTRESPSEATSSGERTSEGNQRRPHRKPERREANTPPPNDGSGEQR